MEDIQIESTPKTPEVKFKMEGVLEIGGRSIPENSNEFYQPLMEWLDEYIANPNEKTQFNFKLEYFNTSSSKCILDVFRKLEQLHKNGNDIQVKWYYEEEDEDMKEAGENYQRIVNVPIELDIMEFD